MREGASGNVVGGGGRRGGVCAGGSVGGGVPIHDGSGSVGVGIGDICAGGVGYGGGDVFADGVAGGGGGTGGARFVAEVQQEKPTAAAPGHGML